jgi:hypothetical protein
MIHWFADFGVEPGFFREELAQGRGMRRLAQPASREAQQALSQDNMDRAKVELGRAEVRALSPNLPPSW